jgi:hypothetical protein
MEMMVLMLVKNPGEIKPQSPLNPSSQLTMFMLKAKFGHQKFEDLKKELKVNYCTKLLDHLKQKRGSKLNYNIVGK